MDERSPFFRRRTDPLEERATAIAVTPRYLTGERWRCCAVFDHLTSDTWHVEHHQSGEYEAFGDEGRLYVGLLREAGTSTLHWHIAARSAAEEPPAWSMDLAIDTPMELITAIVSSLATDADTATEPRPYLRNKRLDDMGAAWQPLSDAGWTVACEQGHYQATSPDNAIRLSYAPPRNRFFGVLLIPEAWHLDVVSPLDGVQLSCATFHDEIPSHLMIALTVALAALTARSACVCSQPADSRRHR
ncbi:DUF317 domain-containing protein [Streptomyces sp. B6B3]|uniref:DUF317 domain-containing protein n=1 Tax=Streptomyces sp. B6B3 TaxID=3153570 RepID=UPI00325D3E31